MSEDPVDLDVTRALRGVNDLGALVRYVVATNSKNETDWLEWKGPLDLTTPPHKFSLAKQILGFSNRGPDRAASRAGGCAYIVVGACPGDLTGQSAIDPADLESGLRRYIGDDGPAWTPVWVTVDGAEVLVILVEPPRWGDPIRTLRRQFEGFEDGAIFVRRPGGSHRASSDELVLLQTRLARGTAREPVELAVDVLGDPLPVIDIDDPYFADWEVAERRRLMAPLEEDEPAGDAERATPSEMGGIGGAPSRMAASDWAAERAWKGSGRKPEDRTPDEYMAAVDQYLAEAVKLLPYAAMAAFVDREIALLRLRLRNPTERNIPAVELEVHLDGRVLSFDEDVPDVDLPAAPRLWGPQEMFGYGSLLSRATFGPRVPFIPGSVAHLMRGYSSENSGSTTIRFDPHDLRPFGVATLEEVPLLVHADVGDVIMARWRATSTGYDGIMQGEFVIPTAAAISIEALLAEPPDDETEE